MGGREGESGGKGDHWHVDDTSRTRFVFPPEMEKTKARVECQWKEEEKNVECKILALVMLFTKEVKKKNCMQIGDIYTRARQVPELLSACQISPS